MKVFQLSVAFAMLTVLLLLVGCGSPTATPKRANAGESGAFPPTLTDMDYHKNPWTRKDCLTCHEEGVQGAPKVKHASVPKTTLDAKCRTCHVLIPGSKPPQ